MRHLNQFILCNGKIPVAPEGNTIDPHNPSSWMSYDAAITAAKSKGGDWGVGFVFTSSDPYWFIDIDHCLQNGGYSELASQLCGVFQGAFAEISMSGTGLHIFGSGPVPEHSCKNKEYGVEFYHTGRFARLTSDPGDATKGNPDTQFPDQIKWLVDNYFPPSDNNSIEWRNSPVEGYGGPADNQELFNMMLRSKGAAAAFGGKATFEDLYGGNVEKLAACYPSLNNKDPYDRSSADMALASKLAFWTGKDHERVRKWMEASALVRPKWIKHTNYLRDTIINAVNRCDNVFTSRVIEQPQHIQPLRTVGSTPSEAVRTVGSQFMSLDQQIEYFKNCVYIQSVNRILTPNGTMIKREVFNAVFGGYVFAMDNENVKTTTSAWDAFTLNQGVHFPQAHGTCFRPSIPSYEIIYDEGLSRVNTYVQLDIDRRKGDVTPFINHLRLLFPVESDFQIILCYMAAVVQHMGVKFQWCPIIQGTEGNGKTFIGYALQHAVGKRYTHFPNAQDLGGNGLKFNAWILNKVLIFIEEIFVTDKRQITESLKTFITNTQIEIQSKGQDQYTGDNTANIIMCSNHKNCLTVTIDNRRYWMHYCPQQSAADLVAAGMTRKYFRDLWNWARDGGFAYIAEFLSTYDIPDDLNPANGHKAPDSSSKQEAISESMGVVEQHIMECVSEERAGFRGGWISSKCMEDLMKDIGMTSRISPRKRSEILHSLGYDKVQNLNGGRVDNIIPAEGKRSTLFKVGTVNTSGLTPHEIKSMYELAQGYIKHDD